MRDNRAIKLMYCDNNTFVLACMINISSGCNVLSLNKAEVVDPNNAARLLLPALLVNTLMANKPMICCAASKLHNNPIQLIMTPIVMARCIMVEIVVMVAEVDDDNDDDNNGRIGVLVEEEEEEEAAAALSAALLLMDDDCMVRNNRLDKRVPFPHVHNIEMVLIPIPMEEMIKLRLLFCMEIDLANNKMIELMTVSMTWDHQLIHDVRCNNLEMCRIKGMIVLEEDDTDDDTDTDGSKSILSVFKDECNNDGNRLGRVT